MEQPTAGGKAVAQAPLVGSAELDAGFRLVRVPTPLYPRRALRLRRPGEVRLEVEVGPGGKVLQVAVLEETGQWGFGTAAREAYREARFSPPTLRGQPVRVRWQRTLLFRP